MKRTWLRLLGILLLLTVPAGCGDNGRATRKIDFLPLKSIEIVPQNPDKAAAGTNTRFTAIGHFGDSSDLQFTRDITTEVSWSSLDTSVLSFSSDPALGGFATAAAAGTTTVKATADSIFSDLSYEVSGATITTLSIPPPSSATLSVGKTLQLAATGTFSDGSTQDLTETVDWSSSDPGVATVVATVPGAGLVSALAQGTVDITATFGTQSASRTLDVSGAALQSIEVTPEGTRAALAEGTTMQLRATGTYSDGSNGDVTGDVTWSSSNTAVAAIDRNAGTSGLLSAISPGSTRVTATLQGVESSALAITVSSATLSFLSISPTNPAVTVGQTTQLTATGDFSDGSSQDVTRDVVWSSGDTSIATVSLSAGMEGTVKGVAAGSVTVIARSGTIPTITGVVIPATVELTVQ